MNRRRPAVVVIACALTALSSTALASCATFNRNDAAAKVGDRTLSTKDVEALGAVGGAVATGDQLRQQLTTWIRVSVLEASSGTAAPDTATTSDELDARYAKAITSIAGDKTKTLYESGIATSPLICLAAITVTSIDEANKALALLNSGTSFADAVQQFSTDAVIKAAGGIVKDQNGNECLDPSTVNPAVTAALKDTPIGQPITAQLDTFAAVLMLRPFDDLLPASQASIASAVVSQDQLDAIVGAAAIYVDPRYGRWDPDTGAVVTFTS